MKYTAQMQKQLLEQIEREPRRPIELPDWAYWKGGDTVYIDRLGDRVSLLRHLYEMLNGPLDRRQGLRNDIGVTPRNVNPNLAVLLPTRKSKILCPGCGWRFRSEDYNPEKGQRCPACAARKREEKAARTAAHKPNFAEINRAKTHCPKGHPYTEENLINLRSGRRRCRRCHAEMMAERRRREK